MLDYISGAVRLSLVTFVLCGFVYPFAVTGFGQLLMPYRANGSIERNADGQTIGSHLIGQEWNHPQWFHGRPSATVAPDPKDPAKNVDAPYNAANTTASNLGPTSRALRDRLTADRKTLEEAQPELAGRLLPADMLTTSGSGLDPDITPANASLQIARVARARNVAPERIAALVEQHVRPRSLWIFGEPRVNVLRAEPCAGEVVSGEITLRAQRVKAEGAGEDGKGRQPGVMLDVIMLALIVVGFALVAAYASLCDHLLGLPADKDSVP